jgi:hypothetical protein
MTNAAIAAFSTYEPIYFVQCSQWGMFPYARFWDGSYPLEDQATDYGFVFHTEEPSWDLKT